MGKEGQSKDHASELENRHVGALFNMEETGEET